MWDEQQPWSPEIVLGGSVSAFSVKAYGDQAKVSLVGMYLCVTDLEESVLWCIGKWWHWQLPAALKKPFGMLSQNWNRQLKGSTITWLGHFRQGWKQSAREYDHCAQASFMLVIQFWTGQYNQGETLTGSFQTQTPIEFGFSKAFYCFQSRAIELVLRNDSNKVLDVSGMFAYFAYRMILETEKFKLEIFYSSFCSLLAYLMLLAWSWDLFVPWCLCGIFNHKKPQIGNVTELSFEAWCGRIDLVLLQLCLICTVILCCPDSRSMIAFSNF